MRLIFSALLSIPALAATIVPIGIQEGSVTVGQNETANVDLIAPGIHLSGFLFSDGFFIFPFPGGGTPGALEPVDMNAYGFLYASTQTGLPRYFGQYEVNLQFTGPTITIEPGAASGPFAVSGTIGVCTTQFAADPQVGCVPAFILAVSGRGVATYTTVVMRGPPDAINTYTFPGPSYAFFAPDVPAFWLLATGLLAVYCYGGARRRWHAGPARGTASHSGA